MRATLTCEQVHADDRSPHTEGPTVPESETALRSFHFRAAAPQELAGVRAWLPDALGGTPAATVTVATDAVTGAVAGIASLRVFVDRVGRFLLFVDPAHRRRGCGTALLESVKRAARTAGATQLLTGRTSEATADDAATLVVLAFLRTRGLSVVQEIVRWRAELKSAVTALQALQQRYENSPIPLHRARIVTADRVDPRALAAFVVRYVGGYPEEVAARLTGRGRPYSLATSMVALIDNAVVGAQLTRIDGSELFVEALAVDASHQGSGVNLALQSRTVAAANGLGIRTIELEHDTRKHKMAKLGRQFAATAVGLQQCWGCPLPVPASEAPPVPPSHRAAL